MVLRFGPFELDADRAELRKSGLLLRLPHQPMRLLLLFVRRAGEVVTRDEIQHELWGSDTHVDFEQGINAAIRQIRYHLNDHPDVPRYLKTIPRRGYVWIAPVELVAPPLDEKIEEKRDEEEELREPAPAPRRRRARLAIASVVALALIAIAAVLIWRNDRRERRTIAVTPFRALGPLPQGIDPNAFTQELRAAIGTLPREHLLLVDAASNDDAQLRIDGTIQRSGDRVRTIVSCFDNAARTQLWTRTYERRMGEHYNVAMQTAHHIAHEVVQRFLPPPRHEPLLRTEASPRVVALYRKARLERQRQMPDPDLPRAAALFEEALREHPQFPEAMSGLADLWVQRAVAMPAPQRAHAVANARDYARRALALQPGNVEARNALALLAFQCDWDLTTAEPLLREAIESDPGYVDAQFNLCAVLAARGEFDEALRWYEKARALDPVKFDLHPAEGMLYLRARRWEEALTTYRDIVRFRETAPARWGILWVSARRGDWHEAASVLRPMLRLGPAPPNVRATESEFRDLFARIEPLILRARDRGNFDDYHVAAYYSMRGDADPAFRALDRAVAVRTPSVVYLMVDPRFDNVRNDSRFPKYTALIK